MKSIFVDVIFPSMSVIDTSDVSPNLTLHEELWKVTDVLPGQRIWMTK